MAIKAAFGGGGRGLKVARTMEEIPEAYESAVREAVAAFGRGECFVERYLDRPRHVEAQVLADQHGNVVVVGTRDCSLQRRHQKLVEEAPAPFLTDEQRTTIHEAARAICREAGYHGAGTVEFLVGADGTISFLEVNTRLQVEHPVTEETTGIDLVREQFRIAAGEPLSLTADPEPRGHSIEFRINGEDPGRNFLPAPGTVTALRLPSGPGVRVDTGIEAGSVIGGNFDSLLAKVIVTGADPGRGAGACPAGAGRDGGRGHRDGPAVPPPGGARPGVHLASRSACTPAGSRPSGPAEWSRTRWPPTPDAAPRARRSWSRSAASGWRSSLPADFGAAPRGGPAGRRRGRRAAQRQTATGDGDALTGTHAGHDRQGHGGRRGRGRRGRPGRRAGGDEDGAAARRPPFGKVTDLKATVGEVVQAGATICRIT